MTEQRESGLAVLGSTGSIGVSTLDVVRRNPSRLRIRALTANANHRLLVDQCREFEPELAVTADPAAYSALADGLRESGLTTRAACGREGLEEAATLTSVDSVMAAIVGAAGLLPTLAAADAGKRLLLANKESAVMAGDLLIAAIRKGGGELIPIDSEHNAIFQCLPRGFTAGWATRWCRSYRPDRVRRAIPRYARRAAGSGNAGSGLCASQVGDGQEDLCRFRHPDEQGAGGYRGLLSF